MKIRRRAAYEKVQMSGLMKQLPTLDKEDERINYRTRNDMSCCLTRLAERLGLFGQMRLPFTRLMHVH